MSWCYGLDPPHSLSLAAYVVLCLSFVLILSDLCGEPWWYGRRTHPPRIADGHLQFLSEHIMRCKYSTERHWHVLPWVVVYLFTFSLVQTLYTWVRLNMLVRLQRAHVQSCEDVVCSKVHVVFVAALVATSLGLGMVVEFDHEYVPAEHSHADSGAIEWRDRIYTHYVGVLLLLGGYIGLHLPIAYLYVMQVYSRHDFTVVCEADEVVCPDRPAQVRRGVYVGTEILYTMLCLLFLVFWLLSMNESAVATEYFLLAAFLVIAVLDGFLSFRLRSAYQL